MQPGFKLDSVLSQGLLDVLIKAGLVATLAIFAFQVFQPFMELMLWSVILAVTLYPVLRWVKARTGLKDGHAATLIVLVVLLVLLAPIYLLATSIGESVDSLAAVLKSGTWSVPAPSRSVAEWPLIGPRLYDFWLAASTSLSDVLRGLLPNLKDTGRMLLGAAASAGGAFVLFIGAIIISGIIMAFGETGTVAAQRIAMRISGEERGKHISALCTATIRAVALGGDRHRLHPDAADRPRLRGQGCAWRGNPGPGRAGAGHRPGAGEPGHPAGDHLCAERRGLQRCYHRVRHLHIRRRPGRQRAQAAAAGAWRRRANAGGADRRPRRHGGQGHHRPVHRSGDPRGDLQAVLAVGRPAGAEDGQPCQAVRISQGLPCPSASDAAH
ncbi:hypothetical protein H681_12015 [Pseudomonas sp. ATCC 13867]|nr:hypothetical protein H681_12015 [Pseudomonas sp. ATCC 13867]